MTLQVSARILLCLRLYVVRLSGVLLCFWWRGFYYCEMDSRVRRVQMDGILLGNENHDEDDTERSETVPQRKREYHIQYYLVND